MHDHFGSFTDPYTFDGVDTVEIYKAKWTGKWPKAIRFRLPREHALAAISSGWSRLISGPTKATVGGNC